MKRECGCIDRNQPPRRVTLLESLDDLFSLCL